MNNEDTFNESQFDYLMNPKTPVALHTDDPIDINGKFLYGFITNVTGKRFREIPNDFVFEMDVGYSVRTPNGDWMWGFKPQKIVKRDIDAGTISDERVLSKPDFTADYEKYKHPEKYQEEVDATMSSGKQKDNPLFNNPKLLTAVVVGGATLITILSFTLSIMLI